MSEQEQHLYKKFFDELYPILTKLSIIINNNDLEQTNKTIEQLLDYFNTFNEKHTKKYVKY